MKVIKITAVVAAFLATAATAFAIREWVIGNTPVGNKPGWAAGVLAVVNLESRAYLEEHGLTGTVTCFYKGDISALNLALRKFAAVKTDERRLVLLPGPGKHYFGSKPLQADWQFYVPGGNSRSSPKNLPPVLTVYVNAAKSREPLDRKNAEKWIAELGADSFQTRQAASRELEKLGAAAKPLLRETLKSRPSTEVRRRINVLWAKFKGFDADDLDIPAGLALVTADDLLAIHLRNLTTDALASFGLVELAFYSDEVAPALTALFQNSKNNTTRQHAAWCLGRLGAAAKPALPALKTALRKNSDPEARTVFQNAIAQIEKARPEPRSDAEVQRRRWILKDLDELKMGKKK